MKRIAIFASGTGTNAQNIIKHFHKSSVAKVVHVLSNNKDAKVLDRAKELNINTIVFDRTDFYKSDSLIEQLKKEVDFIVLAGFLWKVPLNMIEAFPLKIVNIHPALLPKYGGKGMYGMQVHRAIVENKESKSGITIHYVNENYDEGAIIFQRSVQISPNDSPEAVAAKIHKLEQKHFPQVLEKLLKNEQ